MFFQNVPKLKDIESTAALLESLGCATSWDGDKFRVKVSRLQSFEASYDLVRKMRASFLVMGPLLAKYGEAVYLNRVVVPLEVAPSIFIWMASKH